MTENDYPPTPPGMKQVVCYGCKQFLGHVAGPGEEADQMAVDHAPHCPITEEEHAQAVIDIKFRILTKELNL